jgi:4-aminobutyrate aminotransferase-like enzyme
LPVPSYWPTHTSLAWGDLPPGRDVKHPLDARRCTVQLSTGRLYLDAVASPATALLGHDLPSMPAADAPTVAHMLASLAPGYVCLAMTSSFAAAIDFAALLTRCGKNIPFCHSERSEESLLGLNPTEEREIPRFARNDKKEGHVFRSVFGRSAAGAEGRVVEMNALDGEPAASADVLVVHENETLGRTGRWLASAAWKRTPDLIVVGEAIALGFPFGAVLARGGHSAGHDADSAALARVAAAITTVESEGLLRQGSEVAEYLMARLLSMRDSCPQIETVEGLGLSVRIAFTPPLAATRIRRWMCERGVLAGVDGAGRLAIDPPLPLRIAEVDVITGALRGSILSLPMVSASPCCAACQDEVL